MKSLRNGSLLTVLLFLLSYCDNSTPSEVESNELIGRWDIIEATRNGRPTESLAELYFEFLADGSMRTNLVGADEVATFTVNGDEIQQRESRMDVNYEIEQLSDSLLTLTTELRNHDFRFRLRRATLEE
ncbi:MAG: hypothetical protein AAFO07_05900 [Bacteroidota bacterium]